MTAQLPEHRVATIDIDPNPGAAIAPSLWMQFMEPLGATDGSLAAAWDAVHDRWRPAFLDAVRDLAPGAIRWGGIQTSYWRWREGVGPRAMRRPTANLLWGGVETSQVGVDEILSLCAAAGAAPLMGVNFAGDGRPAYAARAGSPEDAAGLVRWCNDPDHRERRAAGRGEPWGVRLWQVGNETSYPAAGQRFERREAARRFVEFAGAMRAADPAIRLIGWGDREGKGGPWWAPDLLGEAGGLVDLVALHMMQQRPAAADTLLAGDRWRRDCDAAWGELDAIYRSVAAKLAEARAVVAGRAGLAITEGHLSLRPHNKCPLLRAWLGGLHNARVLLLYERNADAVEIATQADFFGTTWTVNALMLGSPHEAPYPMPVGKVARLWRRTAGDRLLRASTTAAGLEIAASRRDDTLVLHVVNTDLHAAQPVTFRVAEGAVGAGRVTFIAPDRLDAAVHGADLDDLPEQTASLPTRGGPAAWAFPAASVSAVELTLGPGAPAR
jgi:hypothetical protein